MSSRNRNKANENMWAAGSKAGRALTAKLKKEGVSEEEIEERAATRRAEREAAYRLERPHLFPSTAATTTTNTAGPPPAPIAPSPASTSKVEKAATAAKTSGDRCSSRLGSGAVAKQPTATTSHRRPLPLPLSATPRHPHRKSTLSQIHQPGSGHHRNSMIEAFCANPRGWYQRELGYLKADAAARRV